MFGWESSSSGRKDTFCYKIKYVSYGQKSFKDTNLPFGFKVAAAEGHHCCKFWWEKIKES